MSMTAGGHEALKRAEAQLTRAKTVVHLWDELREKSFHNLVFDSIDALEGHLESALRET